MENTSHRFKFHGEQFPLFLTLKNIFNAAKKECICSKKNKKEFYYQVGEPS